MQRNNVRCEHDMISDYGMKNDFPLAMAYVPWQKEPRMYENLEEGFQNGTIFPELCLPFCGRR